MTDWDNLEGDALNVALTKVAGLPDVFPCAYCDRGYCYLVSKTIHAPMPDYASSIDAQKQYLEPLLPSTFTLSSCREDNGLWWAAYHWRAVFDEEDLAQGDTSEECETEELARARDLGKALEARP